MIKAAALRIGNFILLDGIAKKVVGVSLDLDDESIPIIQLEHANPIPHTDFEYSVFEINEGDKRIAPIPITAKILANCGFEAVKQGRITTYTVQRSNFSFLLKHISGQDAFSCEGMAAGFACSYVHQVQNLFYALSGEELIG